MSFSKEIADGVIKPALIPEHEEFARICFCAPLVLGVAWVKSASEIDTTQRARRMLKKLETRTVG